MQHCPCAHKQKRRHFHAKTTSTKLYIYIELGSKDLFIDKAHTTLDIFRFAVFFPCMKVNKKATKMLYFDILKNARFWRAVLTLK